MVVDTPQLTSEPGTYILLLRHKQQRVLTIGKLGEICFDRGWYVYVGSAFGPGGLSARIGRHLKVEKKYHWHIDVLRKEAWVEGIWTATGPRHMEHMWASALMAAPFNGRGIIGFGCSDCSCLSHLIYFRAAPNPVDLQQVLGSQFRNPVVPGATG